MRNPQIHEESTRQLGSKEIPRKSPKSYLRRRRRHQPSRSSAPAPGASLGDWEVGLVGPDLGGVAPGEGIIAEVKDEELGVVAGAVDAGGVDRPGHAALLRGGGSRSGRGSTGPCEVAGSV
ncbi:hypothetical protein PAHAL_9G429600 [Panicum hallii]|jgi:hypothetical protein|uniref:DUF834 domain-containing protein n=1 Tax=Panicum hallii TaxID=206008 RepID=A0A2T8I4H0_9POAL|nr:hypothetical protein PAHAL_9G429600 [Panicum hallii]